MCFVLTWKFGFDFGRPYLYLGKLRIVSGIEITTGISYLPENQYSSYLKYKSLISTANIIVLLL